MRLAAGLRSLFIANVIACCLVAASAQAADMRFVYGDHDAYPYFAGVGHGIPSKPGMSVELSGVCAGEVGGKVSYSRLPVRRMHEELRAGQVDMVIGLTYTPERAEYLAYPMRDGKPDASRRGATISYMLYRMQGSRVAWDGKRITGMDGPLGVNSGFAMADLLRKRGVDVEEVQYDKQLFAMLQRGRVGAVATLENIGDYYIERSNMADRVEKLQPPLGTGDYYIAASKHFYDQHADLVGHFWDCLARERDRLYTSLAPKYLE